METLEETIYECPSKDNERLEPLEYLNGHESGYYFCNSCKNIYFLGDEKLVPLDDDIDGLPALLMKNGITLSSISIKGNIK